MKKRIYFLFMSGIVIFSVVMSFPMQPKADVSEIRIDEEEILKTSESPILIMGNMLLSMSADYGFGTKDQPFILENKSIDGTGSFYCLWLVDTDAYVIIRNCSFFKSDHYGIYFTNVSNAIITNCSIYNNEITNDGHIQAGIYIDESSNNSIYKNKICDNEEGIFTSWSDHINISNNLVFSNSYSGIWLYDSTNHSICNNEVKYNGDDGIYLYISSNNTIYNNTINYNEEGIQLEHTNDTYIIENDVRYNDNWYIDYAGVNNIIKDNEWWLEDAPIVIWGDEELDKKSDYGLGTKDNPYIIENKSINLYSWSLDDYIIYSVQKIYGYGIVLMDISKHFIIRNCSILNGQFAVSLMNCSYGKITNCSIYDNYFSGTGIYLNDCEFINISKNRIINNYWHGIRLFNSHNNSIGNNTINFHEYGIGLYYSSQNNITWNGLYENDYCITEDAFSEGLNLIQNNTCSKAKTIPTGSGNGGGDSSDKNKTTEGVIYGYDLIILFLALASGLLSILLMKSKILK